MYAIDYKSSKFAAGTTGARLAAAGEAATALVNSKPLHLRTMLVRYYSYYSKLMIVVVIVVGHLGALSSSFSILDRSSPL